MEIFVFVFVITLFIWLTSPKPKKRPRKPGDRIADGLEAAASVMGVGKFGGESSKGDSKGSKEQGPWSIILLTITVGLVVTYLL